MAEKSAKEEKQVLRQVVKWQDLHFYRKSDVLYQLTCIFCQRFLPLCGDRTVDQMVQAARSCKQNIVEGSEDGATSTEMELKLLNVARASNAELREDYLDFIKRHHLVQWVLGTGDISPCRTIHNGITILKTMSLMLRSGRLRSSRIFA